MTEQRLRTGSKLFAAIALLLTLSNVSLYQNLESFVRSRDALSAVTGAVGSHVLAAVLFASLFPVYYLAVWALFRAGNSISARTCTVLVMVAAVALAVGFACLYPRFGAPQIPGRGSDQDDAINILVRGLFSNRTPYRQLTYLGHPISNLMGSAVLAYPFAVVLGSAAWLNPVVVVLSVLLSLRFLGPRIAFVVAALCVMSLGFMDQYLEGGDYFISAIVACWATYWFRFGTDRRLQYVAAVLAAAACTTRFSLVPVLVLTVVAAVRRGGVRALAPAAVALAASAFLILFWYVPAPDAFTPLATSHLMGGPVATLLLGACLVLSGVAFLLRRADIPDLWGLGAVICAVTALGRPDQLFRGTIYGFWWVPRLSGDDNEQTSDRLGRAESEGVLSRSR